MADDERDAKNPIVEEPKSHSKGEWTLEEAIVDIDALIAAQAERRQFVGHRGAGALPRAGPHLLPRRRRRAPRLRHHGL